MVKFFHVPQHRKFNYIPRTYDPEKEKFKNSGKNINIETADSKTYSGYENRLKGSIKRHSFHAEKGSVYNSLTRLVILLAVFILLFGIMFLLLKYFGLLW